MNLLLAVALVGIGITCLSIVTGWKKTTNDRKYRKVIKKANNKSSENNQFIHLRLRRKIMTMHNFTELLDALNLYFSPLRLCFAKVIIADKPTGYPYNFSCTFICKQSNMHSTKRYKQLWRAISVYDAMVDQNSLIIARALEKHICIRDIQQIIIQYWRIRLGYNYFTVSSFMYFVYMRQVCGEAPEGTIETIRYQLELFFGIHSL